MNNEEIEIIDDVKESSVSVENNEQPDTNTEVVNNEVETSENNTEVVNDAPAEVTTETSETNNEEMKSDVETLDMNTNTEVKEETPSLDNTEVEAPISEPFADITTEPVKEESAPTEEVIAPVEETPTTEEQVSEPVVEEPTVSSEEVFSEPTNNDVLNDSAFKIVDNNPVIDPTQETSATEPVKEESAPVENTQPVVENQTPETNPEIVPSDNVTPQEVVSEPVVQENQNTESVNVVENNQVVEPQVNETQPVENQIKEEVVSTPASEVTPTTNPTPAVNPSPVVNNTPSDVVDIKETSTIQNQAGTTVIGQINGDSVSTVNTQLPNSIDVSAKDAQATIDNKTKQVKVKTPRQKITSIIITIIVLAILGVGGYFGYNYYMDSSVSFEVKNINLNIGEEVPSQVSYYVNSSKPINESEYSIDLSNVDTEVGTYEYTVTHKNETKTGTISIGDTSAPVITFKDNLMFSKNSIITRDDIISKCEDESSCTYELETPVDTSVAGSQEVTIVAEDEYGNKSSQSTSISIIGKSLTCKGQETLAEDGTYNERLEDVFYFDDENKLISSVGKKVVTFIDYGSYFALLNDESVKDLYNFDRKTFSYWISNDILYNDGQSLEDIQTYYSTNNYTCS